VFNSSPLRLRHHHVEPVVANEPVDLVGADPMLTEEPNGLTTPVLGNVDEDVGPRQRAPRRRMAAETQPESQGRSSKR
jgi:hypothetical protein